MTDEMEEFNRLLKAAPPPPSDEARKSAILSGMEAFDKHFSQQSQGSVKPSRLMEALRTFHNTIFGGQPMKRSYLLAGTCAATITIILLSSSNLTTGLLPLTEQGPKAVSHSQAGGQPSAAQTPAPQLPKKMAERVASQLSANMSAGELPMPPQQDAITGHNSNNGAASDVYAPTGAMRVPPPPAPPMNNAFRAQDATVSDKKMSAGAVAKSPMKEKEAANYDYASRVDLAKVAPPAVNAMIAVGSTAPALPVPPPPLMGGTPGYAGNGVAQIAPADMPVATAKDEGRDTFEHVKANPMKVTKEEPVSTFSIDVDTSSYTFMRASLNNNVLPQKDSVRIEEYINYFPYEYAVPEDKDVPFKANVSVMPTPWNNKTKLIHIGIKGYQIDQKEKPHANLVFLIDTSGSMNEPNKLPLVKNALKLLLDTLKTDDTVGIVTYAGNAGIALEPTQVKDKEKILAVIDGLQSWGSTAGAEGIRQAYQLAEKNFDKSGVNRVILSTDGDFNVGITNQNELKSFIERERDTGIFLSVLGYGMGNYNDAMMQALAQNGNGNAAYIDNLSEARKALVEEASSTLFTIAKDVKIQVEFNPAKVAEYRLIGYETRLLNREDFNNDKVDAGDIGSGHAVTALYEITPTDSDAKLVDDLRYADRKEKAAKAPEETSSGEYAFVKIRYKLPTSDTSKLITTPVDSKVEFNEVATAPQEARFAASVAAYAQLLRGDAVTKSYTYDDVINLAQGAKGADGYGYRAEFINLVRLAQHSGKLPVQQQNGGYIVVPQPPIGGIVVPMRTE